MTRKLISVLLLLTTFLACNSESNKLEKGFLNPPSEARPRVWWHWLNGNIAEDAVKKDLLWMSRIGIGGFHNFDANQQTPRIVEPVVYMSPEWKQLYRRMIAMADSLGMEMGIAASPGWSETGGPWVEPQEAMKKVVWSETAVEGGKTFQGKLPKPYSISGVYQDIPSPERKEVDFYRDIAVLAFPVPDEDLPLNKLSPKVTTSGGDVSLELLTDGSYAKTTSLAFLNGHAWIQYDFHKPVTVYSLTQSGGGSANNLTGSRMSGTYAYLEASVDGKDYIKVIDIDNAPGVNVAALSFPPVTARCFRLVIPAPKPPLETITWSADALEIARMMGAYTGIPDSLAVSEFNLSLSPRVHRFIEKAGYSVALSLGDAETPSFGPAISGESIIDLTDKMSQDGILEWTPGPGRWKILRMGYSLTGKVNAPASPEATGLEVDKFNPSHVKKYIETYLDMYAEATDGKLGKHGIEYLITDSWEAGTQNWTEEMPLYFQELRGYDMKRFLPTLAGYVIDSPEKTDRFLWDWRKTLGELITLNHYETISASLKARGMKRYTETHENNRGYVGDGMEPKKNADIPMAAMWTPINGQLKEDRFDLQADIRESASVAHIYGQKLVAAESLTSMGVKFGTAWNWTPETLKPTADLELSCGLNRFILHSTVHQPTDDKKPGLSLGIFGHWFNRHETWAEQARPWIEYLSRSAYMMQQGRNVADILYFYGEDSNITTLFAGGNPPAIPEGYNFDYVNADALENVIGCHRGQLTAPSDARYALLVLDPNAEKMTLRTLRAIGKLVSQGARVAGYRPKESPSLVDDKQEFDALVQSIWSRKNVSETLDVKQVMQSMGLVSDVLFEGVPSDAEMHFVHRNLGQIQVYWVNSRNEEAVDADICFRTVGMKPEIWNPVTGEMKAISYKMDGGQTRIPVHFNAFDSFFIVFREKTQQRELSMPATGMDIAMTLEGPWEVSFGQYGAPDQTVFDSLALWTDNENPYIRYYSGTAAYRKHFTLSSLPAGKVWLDLGTVHDLATVRINGQELATLWRPPYQAEISNSLREGDNLLEIAVTNTWGNRISGDFHPGAGQFTWTSVDFYLQYYPLRPSGLEGPISLCISSPK